MKTLLKFLTIFSLSVLAASAPISAQTTINGATVITGGTGGGGVTGLATYSKIGTVAGGVCYVSPYTITTDAFAAINACSSQLPATGGVIDATALGSATYTVTTPLTALNNASQGVTLILNPATIFTINTSFAGSLQNTPAFCAVPVGPGNTQPNGASGIIVPGHSKFNGNFILGPSARVWDGVCTGDFTGNQESLRLDGVTVQSNSSATVGGALMHIAGVFTPTRIANSGTLLCYAQCLEVDAGTTGTGGPALGQILFDNDLFQDGGTGTYPGSVVRLDALSSSGEITNVTFLGGMIQANGPHNPLLVVNGRGSDQVDSIGFYGTTFQTAAATPSAANANVDPIQLTDVSSFLVTNLRVQGATNSATQPNLVDIYGTIPNAQYGINLNQVAAFTGNYTCLVNNTLEATGGTCTTGFANTQGESAIPDYTFGQIFPQIRLDSGPPPTTAGQCVIGSLWTNNSGTNGSNTLFICQGNPGSQSYQAVGTGGGGGGGGIVESGTAYQLGQYPATGTVIGPTPSTYELAPGMTLTQINALFASLQSTGGTVIVPDGTPQTSWTNTNVQVVDWRKNANFVPITRYGAACDAQAFFLNFTQGSNQVNVGSNFGAEAIGKILMLGTRSGFQLGATQAAWTAIITGYTFPNATLSANAPFSFSGWVSFGTDNFTAITRAMTDVGFNYPLSIPTGCYMLTSKPIAWSNAQSIIGQQMEYGGLVGGPGQDILQQPDQSGQGSASSPGVRLQYMTFGLNSTIDTTLGYTSYAPNGTPTVVPAAYRPIDVHMPNSNYPLGPGWLTNATNGVASTTQNSAVMCYSTASGQVAPKSGQTIVFPYLPSVFTTTISSLTGAGCSGATSAATLAAALPNVSGYTLAQAEWFAGTAAQTSATALPVSMTYPFTLTLNLATTPVPGFPANVATHGHVKILGNEFDYLGGSYNSPYSIILRKGPATLTSCNGSGGTCVNTGATVVPLNPCPAGNIFGSTSDMPWPVTPTINSGATTPTGAAYYPGLCGGNAAISFPEANANVYAANGLAYSFIDHLAFGPIANVNVNQANTMAIYTAGATQPYKDVFHSLQNNGLEYGIVQGPASAGQHGVAAFGLTGTGNSFYDITNHAAYPLTFVGLSQSDLSNTDNYSTEFSPYDGTAIGASTCLTYGYTLDDQTGAQITNVNQVHTNNYNCEPENGSKAEIPPATQLFGYQMEFSQSLFEGGYNIVGGAYQRFDNGQWSVPILNYGQNNDWQDIAGIPNVYYTNTWTGGLQFLNWGTASSCAMYGGGQNGPLGICGPGFVQSYNGHSIDAAVTGTVVGGHPQENSAGGQIAPGEWNANASYDPFPMSVGYAADPTELYWGSHAACNVSGSGQCNPEHFDGFNGFIYIGPHQRIVDGNYVLAGNFRTVTGSSAVAMYIGAYDSGTGQCGTTGQIAAFTINATTSWAEQTFGPISFTGRAGCILAVTFGPANTTDQLQVGSFNFVPIPQWQLLQVATYSQGAACTPNGALLGSDTTNLYMCAGGTVQILPFGGGGGGGGGGSFSAITAGTNTAALVMGSGGTLGTTGTGQINATTALTASGPAGTPSLCSAGQATTGAGTTNFNAQGCTTYLQGSLTSTFIPVATGASALANSLLSDNGNTLTYIGTNGMQITSTTPGKLSMIAGTGSIPALLNNSAGFAAPVSGGTPYLIKFPATATAGVTYFTAPAAGDGVNETQLKTLKEAHELTTGWGLIGQIGAAVVMAATKATNAGLFTNIQVVYGGSGSSCTTGPGFTVFDNTATGSTVTGSTVYQAPGTATNLTQTLAFAAGDNIGIQTIGSAGNCTGDYVVTATYVDAYN